MDKKALIAALKKYHFWAALGVALVLVLGIYFVISGPSLAELTQQRETKLRGSFDTLTNVADVKNHPNEGVKAGVDTITDTLKGNVQEAWESLYGEQRAKNQLPETLQNVGRFNEAFEKMMVSGTPLDTRYLEPYRDFIIPYVKEKFKDLDLRRDIADPDDPDADDDTPAPQAGLGRPAFGGAPPAPRDKDKGSVKKTGLVDWEEDNRENILKRFRWTSTPNSDTVLLAQEDLWVYEALLRIILNTNKKTATDSPAVTYENVPVRQIHTLEIADQVSGMVTTGGGEGDEAEEDGAMEDTGYEEESKEGPAIDYPKGRYVDDRGGPLGPGDPHPFAEYKIMPIRMELDIDQRMIPKLLAECDSSNMPVEVRRVRLNPGAGREFRLKLPTDDEGGGDGGVPGWGNRPGREAGSQARSDSDVRMDLYIAIELLGVIYIYNPPDEDKLGTGTVAEEAAEEREEEQTPPEETPGAADETANTGPGQPSLVGG